MTHTPGPYRVQDTPGSMYGKGFRIFSTKGDVLIGKQLEPDGISIGEARRNAALLASAPELLAALQALVDWGREHTGPDMKNSPHELLVAGFEAIKKATSP